MPLKLHNATRSVTLVNASRGCTALKQDTACASPAITLAAAGDAAPGFETMEEGPTALLHSMSVVRLVQQLCSTCHQGDGQGMAGQFPPLAGSGDYYGDAQNHARIIVHGLQGLSWSKAWITMV